MCITSFLLPCAPRGVRLKMVFFAVIPFIVTFFTTHAAEERGCFYALCVGLKYPGTRNSLSFTTDDVRKVSDAFRAASGYDDDQRRVEILVDDDPGRGKPTLREIRRLLADLANEAGENDRLVFYFSGHGVLDKSGRSILVCGDGVDLQDEDSHLPLSEVKDVLARSRASDKLTIIDACHSGGKSGDDGMLTPESVAAAMGDAPGAKGEGDPVAWLVSCGQDEKSWEDDDTGHGLFTRFFLETIGDAAEFVDSDYDGRLSVREIHDYVTKSIGAYILDKNRNRDAKWRGIQQTPQLGLGGARDPNHRALRRLNLFYYTAPSTIQQAPEPSVARQQSVLSQSGYEPESPKSLFKQGFAYYEGANGPPQYDKAANLFLRAAELGDANAQYHLGICFRNGWGVSRNYEESLSWFQKAADKGLAEAQADVGFMYVHGLGTDENFIQAHDWSLRAFEQGSAQAAYVLAYLFFSGQGVVKDHEKAAKLFASAGDRGFVASLQKAAENNDPWAQYGLGAIFELAHQMKEGLVDKSLIPFWYRKAAENGIAWAQYRLGDCYYYGVGTDQDYSEAVKWFAEASRQGHFHARSNLGVCYLLGHGVPKNEAEGILLLSKAAEGGSRYAQDILGRCYISGRGVEQSFTEAIKWLRRSAEQDLDTAQTLLGNCYNDGKGTIQSYSEAMKWYRKAAAQGHMGAQANLGNYYFEGKGTEQNYSEAMNWYQKAAEQDFADAQFMLGLCYEQGIGRDQDYSEAVKWYRKAVVQGQLAAHFKLGYSYYYGFGVSQNYTEAKRLIKIAADKGERNAIEFLREEQFPDTPSGMIIGEDEVREFLAAVKAEDFTSMAEIGSGLFKKGVIIPDHAHLFQKCAVESIPPYHVYVFMSQSTNTEISRVLLTTGENNQVESFIAEQMAVKQ